MADGDPVRLESGAFIDLEDGSYIQIEGIPFSRLTFVAAISDHSRFGLSLGDGLVFAATLNDAAILCLGG